MGTQEVLAGQVEAAAKAAGLVVVSSEVGQDFSGNPTTRFKMALVAASPATAAALGANTALMLDYLAPSPPAGGDPEGYRRVRRAMAHCTSVWMSLRTGKPNSFFRSAKISIALSSPMPRWPESDVRFALSKDDL